MEAGMEFNVSQLIQEPIGATREYELAHERPVRRARVCLTRLHEGILVAFEGEVANDAECSRCLTPFGQDLSVEFEEVFYPRVDPRSGRRLGEPEDPDSFRIGELHTIDISDAVRQYRELAAALQPLCQPDCPGLCQECGADLTMGVCGCKPVALDPRWAVLSALKGPAEE